MPSLLSLTIPCYSPASVKIWRHGDIIRKESNTPSDSQLYGHTGCKQPFIWKCIKWHLLMQKSLKAKQIWPPHISQTPSCTAQHFRLYCQWTVNNQTETSDSVIMQTSCWHEHVRVINRRFSGVADIHPTCRQRSMKENKVEPQLSF